MAEASPLPTAGVEPEQLFELLVNYVESAPLEKEAKKDYAPGLPDPQMFGDLKRLPLNRSLRWVVQEHRAKRAGKHYDVRLGDKMLFSWATKKELPEPGQRISVFQQPLHKGEYADFEGEILSGYGAGTVRTKDKGSVLVTKVKPDQINFTVTHRKFPEMYTLVRRSGPPAKPKTEREKKTQGGTWLMINTTPMWTIPHNKVRYSKVDAEDVEKLFNPDYLISEKIDGAAALYKLFADKIEILSYRTSKRGVPIVHSFRVGSTRNLSIPKKLVGSVLRGEIYGVRLPKTKLRLDPGVTPDLHEEILASPESEVLDPGWVAKPHSPNKPAFTAYNEDGEAVGAVGSSVEGGEHLAQVYIRPEFRGKRYAAQAEELFAKTMNLPELTAVVRKDNAASLKAHRNADYKEIKRVTTPKGEYLYFKKKYPLPKAIHPAELGGLLNSSVERSLDKQVEQRVELKNAIFNILQYGRKPVSMGLPYAQREKLVQEILEVLPGHKFHMPETAKTPEEARRLWKKIVTGKHPRTREGIVAWPVAGGKPTKVKTYPEWDVHVREIFPGEKRLKGVGAGGLAYSLTPRGPVVGKVGTGFSEAVRREMFLKPENWIGRIARIKAQEQLPSGALRAPTFLALHEDYPMKKAAAKDHPLKWKVGDSRIEGKGIIATTRIPAGSDLGPVFRFVGPDGQTQDLYNRYNLTPDLVLDRTRLGRFTNHSYTPTAVARFVGDTVHLFTTRDIKQGGEVSADYYDFPFPVKTDFLETGIDSQGRAKTAEGSLDHRQLAKAILGHQTV